MRFSVESASFYEIPGSNSLSKICASKAGIAAGADGLLLEVHHDPDNSMTGDGVQSLFPDQFDQLIQDLESLVGAIEREI